MKKGWFFFIIYLILSSYVHAEAPANLEGMTIVKQWTDYEDKLNEMPDFIWGNHEGADRIGLYVEFANGVKGSVTYRNLKKSDIWEKGATSTPIEPDTRTGIFADDRSSPLHYLRNIPASLVKKEPGNSLPMAWITLWTPFTHNFDLDYLNSNGSQFRARVPGWGYVTITTYAVPINLF